ncbi:sigma-70 family RNA polymerase sigma factor [Desulfosporosinus fructosivorans]|uniref:Sigma-70 family RNA polymerase sigma factor n=1 Tax=Desulfosporosinus fructosivorans TaxID=2018669 RepID=A0A4Z0RBP7_9FIRM|nr:RNA polymerase sigma factor [Desulfosporosinus fructosivorans]TGE39884.1 sigma-70 family RNA polymerase sigma factor [Desulfosporosinus fructosivorans]
MTNKQLFETYIFQHINSIYRFAYTYTTNQEDAEDVVNESVLKALKSINSLRNPDQIGTWLYRIVANTALTNIKKNKKIVYMDPIDMADVQDDGDDFSDISFEQMIGVLEPKYKSIVVLRFFERMPLEDIALILDENLNTVKTRLYKALKILRIEMEGAL